mmetsp:Transcript_34800/g.69358  ORF Transcript_34800/g.69358 Transcript_34800/m.69358 type:complete len:233 (-) Transcript_34800:509-1207(-)|eukprot:CAMPEP_0174730880 /NCGR_PEP_ID=MMETSP1094-20130205/56456_1 /TAXON_ID=156173 /ORGANISM="Chrysochromulina brevifilum, Strain UTEX LB 985" /LENGTH=232 /DNA_ID=CAMNT_0015933197 /DNA_START=65 /DNA_END=763 /DNA_ORIENTATION=-
MAALAIIIASHSSAALSASLGTRENRHPSQRRRCAALRCWTGETVTSVSIPDVPPDTLYKGFADLSRMTEWSPLLESVVVDPHSSESVWTMRVPKTLGYAARMLGYPDKLRWTADLDAPGVPLMSWTSVLDDNGQLLGLESAAFEPSGSVSFEQEEPNLTRMSLRLCYKLPDPTPSWQVALIQSPPVQFVLKTRMAAGCKRFGKIMRREWAEKGINGDEQDTFREAEPVHAP